MNALPDYCVGPGHVGLGPIAMMEAVQPFVDTAISKTGEHPGRLPVRRLGDLYLPGLARTGSKAWPPPAQRHPGLCAGKTLPPAPAATARRLRPWQRRGGGRTVIESRPKGGLSTVAEKVEYWTQEGHKTLYIIVSFLPVPTGVGNHAVDPRHRILHARGAKWRSRSSGSASSVRLLARSQRRTGRVPCRTCAGGVGPVVPVRLGTFTSTNGGAMVPMWL